MRAAVDPVDDQIMTVLDLVREAAPNDPPHQDPRLRVPRIVDGAVGRGAGKSRFRQVPVQGFDDVAALAHPPERRFHLGRQAPLRRRDFFGKAEPLEPLQPAGPQRLLKRVLGRRPRDTLGRVLAQQGAVDVSQPFLADLFPQPILDLEIRSRAEVEPDDLGGPLAHARRHVFAGDDEVLVPVGLAADEDMAVRMAGVVVVDRDPIELGAEILLDPLHQATDERFEIVVLHAVLGGDDEAELVAAALAAREERLAVGPIQIRRIELARLPLARDAVALDVAQVRLRDLQTVAGQLDDARLDDDPPLPEGGVTVARGQHPADAGAAADAIAVERPTPRPCVSFGPCQGDGAHDLLPIMRGPATAGAANLSELGLELVVSRHGRTRLQMIRLDNWQSTAPS